MRVFGVVALVVASASARVGGARWAGVARGGGPPPMDHKGYYARLGVAPTATAEEIKRAYRQRSLSAHPDKDGGSEEAFKLIGEAYSVLSEPQQRRAYDRNRLIEDTYAARPPPARGAAQPSGGRVYRVPCRVSLEELSVGAERKTVFGTVSPIPRINVLYDIRDVKVEPGARGGDGPLLLLSFVPPSSTHLLILVVAIRHGSVGPVAFTLHIVLVERSGCAFTSTGARPYIVGGK